MASGGGEQSPVNVTHLLKGVEFPAEKPDLIQRAKDNGAPPEVMDKIEAMPDQSHGSMADAMKGFGRTG